MKPEEPMKKTSSANKTGSAPFLTALILASGLIAAIAGGRGEHPFDRVTASLPGDPMTIDGDRNGTAVEFSHARHAAIASKESGGCRLCHHLDAPGGKTAPCARCHRSMNAASSMFNHRLHAAFYKKGNNCEECHPRGDRSTKNSATCRSCHREYPGPMATYLSVISYESALHQTCRNCHNRRGLIQNGGLSRDCHFCHK